MNAFGPFYCPIRKQLSGSVFVSLDKPFLRKREILANDPQESTAKIRRNPLAGNGKSFHDKGHG